MLKPLIVALAAVAGTVVTIGSLAARASDTRAAIEWRIGDNDDRADGKVQLTISRRTAGGHSITSWGVEPAELQGLTPAQISSADGVQVRFRLVRDAGSFECEGLLRQRRGLGECMFNPDPTFATALERRSVGRPTAEEQYSLALHDIGNAYVAELERQGYRRPSIEELVNAGEHGARLEYLQAMGGLGYRVGDISTLVEMKDHGVSTRFVQGMAAEGFGRLPASDLVRMRDHGVSPEYVRDLRRLGYSRLDAEELIDLRDHGVSAGFVRELHSLGYRDFTASELVRLRDHGVSASFVRRVSQSGARLSSDEIIRLRSEG